MNRREFLILGTGTAIAWPRASRAQPAEAPLIGLLHLAPDDPTERFIPRFRRDMKGYGREEGRNLRLLVVSAEGGGDRLPAAARERVARKADLIIVFGGPSIRAARQATAWSRRAMQAPAAGATHSMFPALRRIRGGACAVPSKGPAWREPSPAAPSGHRWKQIAFPAL